MAGVRWNGALAGLQGFDVVDKLESCRRLVYWSCSGREGYAPRTALVEIEHLGPAGPNDLLVIAVGYNDWHARFADDFEEIVAAARGRGYRYVAWVNYRTGTDYELPGGSQATRSNYQAMNDTLAAYTASGDYNDVSVWDLDTYTRTASGWFTPDGVHQTRLGSWGVADWLSRHVAAIDGRPCPVPWIAGSQPADRCPNPDHLPATEGLPDIEGVYGL